MDYASIPIAGYLKDSCNLKHITIQRSTKDYKYCVIMRFFCSVMNCNLCRVNFCSPFLFNLKKIILSFFDGVSPVLLMPYSLSHDHNAVVL